MPVAGGKLKVRRRDADDSIAGIIKTNRFADDILPPCKTALPKAVAENYDRRAARLIFIRRERSPQQGTHLEQFEQIDGDRCAVQERGFS